MHTKLLSLLALCFLLVPLISQSYAQNNQGSYMKIDYLEIDDQELPSFHDDIESVLKPVSEANVEAGEIEKWYLYKVIYPGSHDTNHNIVVVSVCSELCTNEKIAESLNQYAVDHNPSDLLSQYNKIMTPLFSEIWKINNNINSNEDNGPSKFLMLDYMSVTPDAEYTYQMMEDDHAKPIHNYRIENGNMQGWELFQLILPRGEEYGYNFSTANYYNDLKNVEFHFNEEVLRQSSPEADVADFFQNVENVRDLVRSEVWELVSYVD